LTETASIPPRGNTHLGRTTDFSISEERDTLRAGANVIKLSAAVS